MSKADNVQYFQACNSDGEEVALYRVVNLNQIINLQNLWSEYYNGDFPDGAQYIEDYDLDDFQVWCLDIKSVKIEIEQIHVEIITA